MEATQISFEEWKKLTEAEQRARIRESFTDVGPGGGHAHQRPPVHKLTEAEHRSRAD